MDLKENIRYILGKLREANLVSGTLTDSELIKVLKFLAEIYSQ